MKVRTIRTGYAYLEDELNRIGYQNVLNIIPEYENNRAYCIYIIIYKEF